MKTPTTLKECFNELKRTNSKKALEDWIDKEEDKACNEIHFTTGMKIRNDWGLWGKNKLTKWFNSIGIYHADDMSSIILTSFHRVLNRTPMDIKAQIKYYIDYWKQEGFKDGNPLNDSKENIK